MWLVNDGEGSRHAPDQALAIGKRYDGIAVKLVVGHPVANEVASEAQARLLPGIIAIQYCLREGAVEQQCKWH
jgi:hypothetical protein